MRVTLPVHSWFHIGVFLLQVWFDNETYWPNPLFFMVLGAHGGWYPDDLYFQDLTEVNGVNPIVNCTTTHRFMYGILAHIWLIFLLNVGIYTIHGSFGQWIVVLFCEVFKSGTEWHLPVTTRFLWRTILVSRQESKYNIFGHLTRDFPQLSDASAAYVDTTVNILAFTHLHIPSWMPGIIYVSIFPIISWDLTFSRI